MRKQKRKRALTKTTKKTIPNPGRWGGVINTWVCAASRFCFFLGVQAAGTSLVARFVQQFGRLQGEPEEETSGWCRTVVERKVSGRFVHLWCTVQRCAKMISLKSASAVCHNAAANKIRAWSFSKMTSLAKHPDYYKKLVFLFSLINNKQKESYPLVCVPVR